jgi:hypothetical protein
MLHVVTYATHSSGYFELLKASHPNITVLGWGAKWNGFYDKAAAVCAYCDNIEPESIVLVVDGFDSIILGTSEQILERFKNANSPLIFSKAMTSTNIFHEYMFRKFFPLCNKSKLNAGLYIGKAGSIIDHWKGIQIGDDDQLHSVKNCEHIKVDDAHELFYNYSSKDRIKVRDNSVYIHDEYPTFIIGSPGDGNMNSILEQLGYTNLPAISINYVYRVKTYGLKFIPEFLVLCICILLFVKHKLSALIVSTLLVCFLIIFETRLKHML